MNKVGHRRNPITTEIAQALGITYRTAKERHALRQQWPKMTPEARQILANMLRKRKGKTEA